MKAILARGAVVAGLVALPAAAYAAAPNFTPYQPSGWSNKIVVSKTTGTHSDDGGLTPSTTLYVDWAIANVGTAAPGTRIYTALYVDGVFINSWFTDPPFPVGNYASISDYSIGTLSAGTHTLMITADATGAVAETSESDNTYTRTITVSAAPSGTPNLTPYQPGGWAGKIVVSKTTGTHTDDTGLTASTSLYLDWAVINSGNGPLPARMYTELYVDGVLRTTWHTDPPLTANSYTYIEDSTLGTLSAGTHTLMIKTDSSGVISESNESDNTYTKTITIGGGTPNLTPYQPSGWSDKIVVSKTTGTTSDDAGLTPSSALYLDWAIANTGSGATAVRTYTELYVDGTLRSFWYTDPPFAAATWAAITDYPLGSLSAGTHTLQIKTDATGTIAETSETDNTYTKTITIGSSGTPNLTPYQPSGWPDKIVVSKVAGTHGDDSGFTPGTALYLDWAVINNGGSTIGVRIYSQLYVDGTLRASWYTDPPFAANAWTSIQDYPLGTLTAGTHTLQLKTDTNAAVAESSENDNSYTKTITIAGVAPKITGITPTSIRPSTFTLTITGTAFDSNAIDQIYWKSSGSLVGNGTILSRTSTQIVVQESMTGATAGTYQVRVRNGDGTLSNAMDLTLAAVPDPPVLLSPGASSEGQSVPTLTPTFQWSGNGTSYSLTIRRAPYGSGDTVYSTSGLTGSAFSLPGGTLTNGVQYRWHMTASNSAGESPQSNPLYFRVGTSNTGSINGIVKSSSGQAISGAQVIATSQSTGSGPSPATTDATGQFSFGNLAAGGYVVSATKAGFSPGRAEVTVVAGGAVAVSLVLSPTQSSVQITSLKNQYSGSVYFLPNVPLSVRYTATIDWGGHSPGSVDFLTGGRSHVVSTSGNTASITFNVATDLQPCDTVSAVAISADGSRSGPVTAAGQVTRALPPFFSALALVPVSGAGGLLYESNASVSLPLIDWGTVKLPRFVPLFAGRQVAIGKASPEFESEVRNGQASFLAGFRKPGVFKMNVIGEIDVSVKAGATALFSPGSCEWSWQATVKANASMDEVKLFTSPTFFLPTPAGPVPVYLRVAASANATGTLNWQVVPTSRFAGGSFEIQGRIRGGIGVGVADVFGVEGTILVTPVLEYAPAAADDPPLTLDVGFGGNVLVYVGIWDLVNYDLTLAKFRLYPPDSAAADAVGSVERTDAQPRVMPRDYLNSPRRSANWDTNTAAPSGKTTSVTALETAVFPHSDPHIDRSGGPVALTFVRDNTGRSSINRTEAVLSRWDGAQWSAPQSIADDGTADFHPRVVSFPDGSALVVWENVGQVLSDSTPFADALPHFDIGAAFYDSETRQWRAPADLARNTYLDRSPRVAGPSRTDAIAMWVSNIGNSLLGSSSAPNTIWSSRWNGTGWSTAQLVATVPYPLLKYDLAYDGANALVALSLDVDGDTSTIEDHELFTVTGNGSTWGALTRATSDAVPDDNPQLARTGADLRLLWLHGGDIRAAVGTDVAGARTVAAPTYSSNVAGFKLSAGEDGKLAVLWIEPTANDADVFAVFYDPAFDVWGDPVQLTNDNGLEANLAAVFDTLDHLSLVYNRTTGQSGSTPSGAAVPPHVAETDLISLRHALGVDLAVTPGSVTASNDADQSFTLGARIDNLGELAVQNVTVTFYDGDPAAGGRSVAVVTTGGTLAPGAHVDVTAHWTPSSARASVDVFVTVDAERAVDDRNRANNTASSTAGRADLAVDGQPPDLVTPGQFQLTARVSNRGTAQSPSTTVTFRAASATGAVIRTLDVPALVAGTSIDVTFTWNSTALSPAPGVIVAIVDDANAIVESDETNNSALIPISCSYSASAGTTIFPNAGGQGTIAVQAEPGCGWGASSDVAWIAFLSGANGTGSATATFRVAANTARAARRGIVTVGGRTVTIVQAGIPMALDFDGDSRADAAFYRGNGDWAILKSGAGYTSSLLRNWGGIGYSPVPGDYDGDGVQDLAVYRMATGEWLVLKSSTSYASVLALSWGGSGYVPVPGDYDGDGRMDPAVYRPATGEWFILKSTGGYATSARVAWGGIQYTPVSGMDFDGDRKSDIAVYHAGLGRWLILKSGSAFTTTLSIDWGGPGYTLVPGDYDGDGRADVGVYDRKSGWWYVLRSDSNFSSTLAFAWGGTGYIAAPGDYDGDARMDMAVFQPASGIWYVLKSSTAFAVGFTINGWGTPADSPLAATVVARAGETALGSDMDGDSTSDITVYNAATASWHTLTSTTRYAGAVNRQWGRSGNTPVAGDFDGDGQADRAVYDAATGTWFVLTSSSGGTNSIVKSVGGSGWLPVAGDYDGDGRTDFVVYKAATGQWYGLLSGMNYSTTINVALGGAGFTPVPADFDGDGRADVAVYANATGVWTVRLAASNFASGPTANVGGAGWIPVGGDHDGDGKADFIVYNTTTGVWFGLKSSGNYTTTLNMTWGGAGYAPVKGDFDGDGKADLATYVQATGTWYILLSGANYTTSLARSWGGPGYAAVPQYP